MKYNTITNWALLNNMSERLVHRRVFTYTAPKLEKQYTNTVP